MGCTTKHQPVKPAAHSPLPDPLGPSFVTRVLRVLTSPSLRSTQACPGPPDLTVVLLAPRQKNERQPVVIEPLLDWMDPSLTTDEADRLVGWHLGVRL